MGDETLNGPEEEAYKMEVGKKWEEFKNVASENLELDGEPDEEGKRGYEYDAYFELKNSQDSGEIAKRMHDQINNWSDEHEGSTFDINQFKEFIVLLGKMLAHKRGVKLDDSLENLLKSQIKIDEDSSDDGFGELTIFGKLSLGNQEIVEFSYLNDLSGGIKESNGEAIQQAISELLKTMK